MPGRNCFSVEVVKGDLYTILKSTQIKFVDLLIEKELTSIPGNGLL